LRTDTPDTTLPAKDQSHRIQLTTGTILQDVLAKLPDHPGAQHYKIHALDYLVYAYLQRGQYGNAEAIRREVLAMQGPYLAANRGAIAFAFAAIPARCALERQDWAAAAALELERPASFPWEGKFPHCESIVRFARVLGAVRS